MSLLIGLAPMAGFTDQTLRLLCARMGATYTCSEMVSAIGLMYAKPGSETYRQLLSVHPEETGVACQLFGSDPAMMGEAAARITELGRFASIDINMGCPARKVVGGGDGSALLLDPPKAARVMEAVKTHTTLPCTLKTRLGFDDDSLNALSLCEAAESLGFAWVTVHGRTRKQQFSGSADYEALGKLKARLRIPLMANGDIACGADALRALSVTGADGVMIGRAALGNPWVFRDIRAALDGKPCPPVTLTERLDTALLHTELMTALKGEHMALLEMRKQIGHYIGGLRGAAAVRRAVNNLVTLPQLRELLDALREQAQKEEA